MGEYILKVNILWKRGNRWLTQRRITWTATVLFKRIPDGREDSRVKALAPSGGRETRDVTNANQQSARSVIWRLGHQSQEWIDSILLFRNGVLHILHAFVCFWVALETIVQSVAFTWIAGIRYFGLLNILKELACSFLASNSGSAEYVVRLRSDPAHNVVLLSRPLSYVVTPLRPYENIDVCIIFCSTDGKGRRGCDGTIWAEENERRKTDNTFQSDCPSCLINRYRRWG